MNKIWAKQLILGTKKWSNVPSNRKAEVKTILQEMIENGAITKEQYDLILEI